MEKIIGIDVVKSLAQTHAKEAHDRRVRIIALKQYIEELGHDIGGELFEFQHRRQWRNLGYMSFNAFLSDPYINIAKRTAQRLIRVHKAYIIRILTPLVAHIENEYYPDEPPPEVQQEIVRMNKEFRENMARAGTTKLDMAVRFIDGKSVTALMNSATILSKPDFKAHLIGIEPVYTHVAWRDVLHDARNACERLVHGAAPDEVQSFALDFWAATSEWD